MAHQPYTRIVPGSSTVLVMIHGIIGTPDHFRDFLPLVPEDWSVYNLLLDGHGGGVREFSASSMDKWKTQVARLVERLCLQYRRVLIAAHSMGTLFAFSEALRHPGKIAGLFLLAAPLQVRIGPLALSNSIKVCFGRVRPDDAQAVAAKAAYGLEADRRLWRYLGWLPRYWELLQEIRRVRRQVSRVQVPCYVYQSRKDELVSAQAVTWLRGNENIHWTFLESSTHFHYRDADFSEILTCFSAFCAKYL